MTLTDSERPPSTYAIRAPEGVKHLELTCAIKIKDI